MRRVTAVVSTLGLPADRAEWSTDHNFGRNQRTPRKEEGGLPSCHTPGVSMRHSQTGSRRSPKSAHQITALVEHDVRLRVKQREICQASKHGRLPGEAGRRRLYAGRPWQVIAVDLVGPMPITPRGNSWILILTDHFTRWADALAIPDASAPIVARGLDQNMFCYFGLPEQLHSDQGAQFQSQLLSNLCCLRRVN